MELYEVYGRLSEIQRQGLDVALATVIRTRGSVPRHAGSKMIVFPDGRFEGTVGGGLLEARAIEAALECLKTGQPEVIEYHMTDMGQGDVGICGGTVEVLVEPVLPPPTVLVVGCGHVGKEVAFLAKWIGFRVLVSDDRADLCNPETIPGMDGYYAVPSTDLTAHAAISSQTYVAAMTRGQSVDLDLLPPLLKSPARYIGVIGSRRRWALTLEALREKGISEAEIARVHSPVGLELNAETPREIALSILAEIVMVQRGGDGRQMQWLGQRADAASGAGAERS